MPVTKQQELSNIFNKVFRHTKKLAKDYYFNDWAKNPPKCSAFNNETVAVGREGWEHTTTTIRRTKMDVLGRLFCLEKARHLLEKATTFQDYRKIRDMEFWVLESVVDNTKIKVVIRSIKGGHKHFYSVIRRGSVEDEIESK